MVSHFTLWQCDGCGSDLVSGESGRRFRVCVDCSRIARREREAWKDGRLYAVQRDPYTLEEIAARDKYRCQICLTLGQTRQAKVNMELKVPHLKAATINHVVALSRGGDDTRGNVQLAHFSCNSWKNDGRKLDQQPALF